MWVSAIWNVDGLSGDTVSNKTHTGLQRLSAFPSKEEECKILIVKLLHVEIKYSEYIVILLKFYDISLADIALLDK